MDDDKVLSSGMDGVDFDVEFLLVDSDSAFLEFFDECFVGVDVGKKAEGGTISDGGGAGALPFWWLRRAWSKPRRK